MIAVEIPAALADDPQVVPVDSDGHSQQFLSVALVGQRVALAWRETCDKPGCVNGWIGLNLNEPTPRRSGAHCPDCSNGERMVVGWTAEVEAVVPIIDCVSDKAHVCVHGHRSLLLHWELNRGTSEETEVVLDHLRPLADWSPGRYALVLRGVQPWATANVGGAAWPTPESCRPFSGFAELDEVLA